MSDTPDRLMFLYKTSISCSKDGGCGGYLVAWWDWGLSHHHYKGDIAYICDGCGHVAGRAL